MAAGQNAGLPPGIPATVTREPHPTLAQDGRMMDRSSLRDLLDRERIDPRAYGLDGPAALRAEDREERYFLEESPPSW